MLVANPLLVDADPRNRQYSILLVQPPSVQLTIRHDPQEDQPEPDGQEARD